ncbi:hypothetical protein BC941DRAFT_380106 [Chlamydoabsidia padenii]|nr:hypothetical protein BC941DRAFT_380106 [Chlamydoabsidia padenii]
MKYQFFSILVLLSFLFISPSFGYYSSQPELLVTLPLKEGVAADKRGQSLIVVGGESNLEKYTNGLNQLTQTPTGYNWTTLPQQNTPPASAYGRAVVAKDGNTMLLIGGITNATNNQAVPLQIYQYNFGTTAWSGQVNTAANNATPVNRWLHTTTQDPNTGKIYIYGGAFNTSVMFADFWLLDPTTMAFTALPAPQIRRYGHTATLMSNGQLVILGGAMISMNYDQGTLAPMTQLQIFDTTTNQWTTANTTAAPNNVMPSPRAHHNAVLINGTKILMFGGDNNGSPRELIAVNSVFVLDTTTWSWTSPSINGIPPSRRGNAIAAMLDDRHLTVTFGASGQFVYNDVNALDTYTFSWLQSFTDNNSSSWGLSTGVIVGVSIACVVLFIIICFLLWKFGRYLRWLIMRIHSDIWKPRSGEPLWAETTRICFQIFLLFLFFIFLAFVVRQAVTSPNVTQNIQQPAASVDVPDIRFCFDGYPTYSDPNDPRNPGVACQTNNGYTCTQFIQPLNMSVFQPSFADKLGPLSCYLFRADPSFQMTSTSGANNGSRLLFTLFGDQSIVSSRIHLSAFPRAMDPNAKIYNINDATPVLLSRDAVLNWQNAEINDIQSTNIFSVEPFTYSAMGYTLLDHQYLQDVGWNYVGFLPVTNSTPEIDTHFRMEAANPVYAQNHPDIGMVAVTPDSYTVTTLREVKMYNLVNALGFVGGIFGLLVALQAWLFGYRPRSPWGVVHRWSIGDMKRSLLRGLQSKFKTTDAAGIPLVHPVHKRFSVTDFNNLGNETESQRISRVEERMQVMELLFKAYYVDDEVFRSLDNANKAELGSSLRQRNNNMAPILNNNSVLYSNLSHGANAPEEKFDMGVNNKPAKSGEYELIERHDTSNSSNSSTHTADNKHPTYI